MIINPTASDESGLTGERREHRIADPGSGSITVARREGERESRYHCCIRVSSRSGKLEEYQLVFCNPSAHHCHWRGRGVEMRHNSWQPSVPIPVSRLFACFSGGVEAGDQAEQ